MSETEMRYFIQQINDLRLAHALGAPDYPSLHRQAIHQMEQCLARDNQRELDRLIQQMFKDA